MINNPMENAIAFRREIINKETPFSLFQMAEREMLSKINDKESLLETPHDVFSEMKNDNEIRGNFTKIEFLKLGEDDLAIAITDIHGDREKLGAVLDYIKKVKPGIKGKIHLINLGDTASLEEDVEVIFDLLKGQRNDEYILHYLGGNVERDALPAIGLHEKVKKEKMSSAALPAMTNFFKLLPGAIFLDTKNGTIMLTHSMLPLVNKRKFEKEGLRIFDKDSNQIDRMGLRGMSGVWAVFDGEKEHGELGGEKMFQLGKSTFESAINKLGLQAILRGHDSSLIKGRSKETGVHRLVMEKGEVDTFHTSRKATGEFGVFAEIKHDGSIYFKKV